MLVTLIPLFDEKMSVQAYSLFSQKNNYLLNPSLQGTGQNDGAVDIPGFEVIKMVGLEALATGKEIFVTANNISVFSDINFQCQAPHERLVLLIDSTIPPEEMYINRLRELKGMGYKLAIRKLEVHSFEAYREILLLMDYIFLDHKKVDVSKAKIFFSNLYPNVRICVVNIQTQEIFEKLKEEGGYQLYEGEFYRVPVTKGETEVTPLKINYIELLNMVNAPDFDLTKAADVIGRDTALVISLLKMVNTMAVNSEITSIRHAAAMLGQRELKKWINAAVANNLYADKPNEVTRLSLLRAKFAENLAPMFEISRLQTSELFLMGLFSVLDLILNTSMEEALKMVKVSKEISDALIDHKGVLAPVLEFVLQYEKADWQEVSRLMILQEIEMEQVYTAYMQSLQWYCDLFSKE
ncbi:MAG: HDOD domain-containing protein [Lachnospiraceae bacterium]|nr:HDOD domain-containing protein [Lachnospiraceae bacterium]MDE7285948.1 HDOD domain-containing protein [Lachnospiraceae bacterium]